MSENNYDSLYNKIIELAGNQLSNFEQLALLIHSVFLMNDFTVEDNKLLNSEWNKDYGSATFKYIIKRNNISGEATLSIKEEYNKLTISIKYQQGNNSKSYMLSYNKNENYFTNINFNNLNSTIKDLEKRLCFDCIDSIKESLNSNVNNIYTNPDNYIYDPNFSGEEWDPHNIRIGGNQDIFPNPYFSTGGGAVPGGNLIGPNSDIFTGNFPRPGQPGSSKIRYDPIGPFGTFGGPNKKDPFGKGGPFGGFGGGGPFI
jgi:hypothetical protein